MIQKLMTDILWPLVVENRQYLAVAGLLLAKECFEYWLGKTKKVEAGSTLELIINFIKKVKNAFKT